MKPAQSTAILQAEAINFSYPDRHLFTHFSVQIPPGITLICGGDGRGKSTLLRLLAGTLPAQSGQLTINDADLQTQAASYRAQVFLAEPRSEGFDQLTVPDYFDLQRSSYPGFDNAVLADIQRGLSLEQHLHKQLFMLSTGTKRKVFLAAAFAAGAAVTLLDEPFAALDAASIGFVLQRLQDPAPQAHFAWVIADYVAPDGLRLTQVIDLGE